MLKLDKKDRKILHQLEIDSRQSCASIGKEVGLSREVVSYRINRLEKQGVIDKYVVILNYKKIGYESYKWYLQLENTDYKKLQEIIESLKKHPYCVWINTCTGKWDLIAVFLAISSLHFKSIIRDLLVQHGKYVRETSFTIELDIYHFKKKYFQENELKLYEPPYIGGELENIKLDKEEIKILAILCENPKKSVVEIAHETNLTIDIVHNRLKHLKKNGIFQGARTNIINSKLGIESYKLLINTKIINSEKEKQFANYLNYNHNVGDVIYCLGNWDMEINIDVENSSEFHGIVMEIKNKFPELIRNYESIQLFDNYKYNFFPMGKVLLEK